MITVTRVARETKLKLNRFGFNLERGGVHTSRTMMLDELQTLLSEVNSIDAKRSDYLRSIEDENCLRKRSGNTRTLTARHLTRLYSLDPSVTIFRTLLFFWNRDFESQPLIALLCAYSRDPILRFSAHIVLKHPEGSDISREEFESAIERAFPNRFSKSTLESTARNILSTWTNSGHLVGRTPKKRCQISPGIGAISYGLLLGYLTGLRGESLFESDFLQLLDTTPDITKNLTIQASQRGWLSFKRLGNVLEVSFPNLLTEQEVNWSRE